MASNMGEVIRGLREARRLSAEEVEQLSRGRVRRAWLSQLEAGTIEVARPEMLEPLADVLEVTVGELYEWAGLAGVSMERLSLEEMRLLRKFRAMSYEERASIDRLAEAMSASRATGGNSSGSAGRF